MSDPTPSDLPAELRVPEREVELLYSIDWWDGPLSGLAKHKGRYFWFQFYCDDGDGKDYFYRLHAIPASEEEAALAWFARYKDYQRRWIPLGNDPATCDLPSTKALQDEWQSFGDSRFDYASRPWTAWFCSGENASFYAVQITKKEEA
jgi:hypothetical protein